MPVGGPQRPLQDAAAGRGQQPRQFGYEVRPGPPESLHHGVRGGSDERVFARGDVCEQFEHGRVRLLDVVNQDQLEPLPLGGQELRGILEDLPGRRDDAGRVEGFGHTQIKDIAILGVQCRRGGPIRPVAALREVRQVPGGAPGFDDPVKELADLLPEAPGLQGGVQVSRPGKFQARLRVAFEEFLNDQVLFRSGQEFRRTWQRQDAFRFGAPDQIEGIRRPGAGRRRAQAAVQARGEAVAQRIGGEPPGGQDQHPLGIQAVAFRAPDGRLDQDRGLPGPRRAGDQDRS